MAGPNGDVHDRVRRFNEDEAVWLLFEQKRTLRRLLRRGIPLLGEVLDHLDWIAAERECREIRAIGRI